MISPVQAQHFCIEPLDVVNLNNDIKRYAAEEKVEVERISSSCLRP
jgi:dsDNA-specific endonuclease/ATPase MutS2